MSQLETLYGSEARVTELLGLDTLDPLDHTLHVAIAWDRPGPAYELRGRFVGADEPFHFLVHGPHAAEHPLVRAIWAHRDAPRYRAAWAAALPHLDTWLTIGRANDWIREATDPPFSRRSFGLYRSLETMAAAMARSRWSLGSAFACGDICAIAQTDGGSITEFLIIRGAVAFESFSVGDRWMEEPQLLRSLTAIAEAPLDPKGIPIGWYERTQDLAQASS